MWKILFLLLPGYVFATGDSLRYLTPRDTIILSVGANDAKIFEHKIEKGQTIFSLARFYGLKMDALRYLNPSLNFDAVSPKQRIKIPIPNRAIIRYREAKFNPKLYTPVYYRVKKGDNLFRLSKVYFRMPEDTIKARANLKSGALQPGQLILIGWMNPQGVPADWQTTQPLPPSLQKAADLKQHFDTYSRNAKKKEFKHQGIAVWQKEAPAARNYYALHDKAPINSILEIHNPVTKRTVYAEVLGKIPATAYSTNVVVILSPNTAKLLGAKDANFFVKIKYYK
ncbi:MAG: LysM peptidoglycan-binding domain-containing protein [Haliscomenobacter sp.]|nr:LysM peptidoglycan-binding domain-containing protein [Haliscomenobacter sp.]MBK9488661.1 LysM peptidoglycan-binding domain-containing protein [Haliscomenobacter sp.]